MMYIEDPNITRFFRPHLSDNFPNKKQRDTKVTPEVNPNIPKVREDAPRI